MRKSVQFLIILVAVVFIGLTAAINRVKAVELTPTVLPTIIENNVDTNNSIEIVENSPKIDTSRKVEYAVDKWNGFNTFKIAVQKALNKGVSANTIVLLLLLPLIATLVSVLHYVVGLTGYGIFMPTMIAVTFLATGIFGGLMLFALILVISLLSNLILKKLRIHFWPARAINLLFISIGTFALMMVSASVKIVDISQISIFPMLFMIMLAEEFVRTQIVKSKKEAKKLTLGTLVLSITGAIAMSVRSIQSFVLFHPEMVILLVLAVNLVVGNYTGIRLMEINRFKKAIREKGKKVKIKN